MISSRQTNIRSTEKFDSVLVEEGIIEIVVKEAVQIEVEDLYLIKEANIEVMGDRKYCVIVTSHFLSSISKEARELVASKEYSMNTIAKALIVNSIGQQMVGNFYLKVNRPHIKTKLFSERNKAIEWLRKQLNP